MNRFSHIELDEKKLANQTLDYILNNQNTCLGSSLSVSILDPRINYGDLNNHIEFLKERLSHLQFIVDYDEVTFENKIWRFSGDTFEQIRILENKRFAIENFSKEIFWANKQEERNYQNISSFNCFEEKILSEEKFKKTIINVPFNLEGWIYYYQKLLSLKFPEFSEEIVSGMNIIRYYPFKRGFFLGIETDYKQFKSNLRNDYGAEPHHKLIIFRKLDKKKIDKVVTIDKFVHPHFDPPAYSFGWYFYAKNTVQVSDIELSAKYIVEREFLDDGNVKLSMSEKFGEYLKRHAYFYYDMLYHTTKEYIKFIEESFVPENE